MAVSRIQEIVELPPEEETKTQSTLPLLVDDPDKKKDDDAHDNKKMSSTSVDPQRTIAGSVSFQNVVLRYKPDLPPALNNISFKVKGEQKVGIVGRTGCGKSTVLQALFKMVGSLCFRFYRLLLKCFFHRSNAKAVKSA